MKQIGIIGDVHAEDLRLRVALDFLREYEVDAILCTGDLPDGRGDLDMCCQLLQTHGVMTVAGNHERWFLQDKVRHVADAHLRCHASSETVAYLSGLPQTHHIDTVDGELLLCHGILDDDLAKIWPGSEKSASRCSAPLDKLLQQDAPPRFLINGHMHFRTVIDFPKTQVINGGTLKGQFAGFSLLDIESQCIHSFNFTGDQQVEAAGTLDLASRQDRRVWQSTGEFDGVWQPVMLHRG